MAAALTTLAVALLAYLLGRSTLPLFVGRSVEPPGPVLQLELLLGNALLSIIGLLLAETGQFALRWVVGIAILVCTIGFAVRASRAFRPAEVDRASDDQRALGVQVRPRLE